jgi:hypothetical protein
MHTYIHIHAYMHTYIHIYTRDVHMHIIYRLNATRYATPQYVCVCERERECVCVCLCVFVCVYVCVYTHTQATPCPNSITNSPDSNSRREPRRHRCPGVRVYLFLVFFHSFFIVVAQMGIMCVCCVYVCVCVCVCMLCMCVCVCTRTRTYKPRWA